MVQVPVVSGGATLAHLSASTEYANICVRAVTEFGISNPSNGIYTLTESGVFYTKRQIKREREESEPDAYQEADKERRENRSTQLLQK